MSEENTLVRMKDNAVTQATHGSAHENNRNSNPKSKPPAATS